MKNKVLRSILSISVLSLGLEFYHSHHQETEGYFYCNVDCSNNDHHETAHDCYYCTHQNNLNLTELNRSIFKLKPTKSSIIKNKDINYHFISYLFNNKSPPLNNLI